MFGRLGGCGSLDDRLKSDDLKRLKGLDQLDDFFLRLNLLLPVAALQETLQRLDFAKTIFDSHVGLQRLEHLHYELQLVVLFGVLLELPRLCLLLLLLDRELHDQVLKLQHHLLGLLADGAWSIGCAVGLLLLLDQDVQQLSHLLQHFVGLLRVYLFRALR